jgi:hypothetical protein
MRIKLLPILLFSRFSRSSAGASQRSTIGAALVQEQGYVPSFDNLDVACHGCGYSRRAALVLDPSLLVRASNLLKAGHGSPASERRTVGPIVKSCTAYLAREFGGNRDAPARRPEWRATRANWTASMRIANTTSPLVMLQEKGLFTHHGVECPLSHGLSIGERYPHITVAIAKRRHGREWVIDP